MHLAGATTLTYTFEYDVADRLTNWSTPDGAAGLSYDAIDQLLSYDHDDAALDQSHDYDGAGNRSENDVGAKLAHARRKAVADNDKSQQVRVRPQSALHRIERRGNP